MIETQEKPMIETGDLIVIECGLGFDKAYGQIIAKAENIKALANFTLHDTDLIAKQYNFAHNRYVFDMALLSFIEEVSDKGTRSCQEVPIWIFKFLKDPSLTLNQTDFQILITDSHCLDTQIFFGVSSFFLNIPFNYSLVKDWTLDEILTCENEEIRKLAPHQKDIHVE